MQITVSEPTPEFNPGSYEMVLVNVEARSFPEWATERNKFGQPDNGDRIEWTWGHPEDETLEITQLTTTSSGPRSAMFPILVALLGAEKVVPGLKLDSSSLIGKKAIVTIGINEKGFSRVTGVGPLPTSAPVRRRPVPQPVEEVSSEDGLPF